MALVDAQGELFLQKSFAIRPALIAQGGEGPFFVIGCSREKRTEAAPASKLYTSKRFKASLRLPISLGAPYAILSGKHGLVAPEATLKPYDLYLPDHPAEVKEQWASKVLEKLRKTAAGKQITLLASPEYASPLIELNQKQATPLSMETPWTTLTPSDIYAWLAKASRMAIRIRDLTLFYKWIDSQRLHGLVFPFRSLATQKIPARGVYVFLDRQELNFLQQQPRIVRIGTHAVSQGSKATLRNRLRNHLGPTSEIGNHRGSIFRLHVGRAMLEATNNFAKLPSWGEGQHADERTKAGEVEHELAVSRYLQELEVALIPVDDEPTKQSARATIEAQLIALCSESMTPIDEPSPNWLGLKSPVAQIRQSGLWNIRGVGGKYDADAAIGSIASIVHN